MSLFNSGTGRHTLQSLTADGSQAAVYPSEDQLWLYGPTITNQDDDVVDVDRRPIPVHRPVHRLSSERTMTTSHRMNTRRLLIWMTFAASWGWLIRDLVGAGDE